MAARSPANRFARPFTTAFYLEVNAGLQLEASRLGKVNFLTPGEIEKVNARLSQGKPGEGFSFGSGNIGAAAPEWSCGSR